MYKLELLILLCIISAILGMCISILIMKRRRKKNDGSFPLARNIKVVFADEVSDKDMMVAIATLSKMKLTIDRLEHLDKRKEFKEAINKIIDEVYEDDR